MEELWAEIPGFPNYQISDQGQVFFKRFNRFLSPGVNSEGVLRVTLYDDGVPHIKYVHLMVAQAFLPWYHGQRLTWLNNNRFDCRAENLVPKANMIEDNRPRRPGWGRRVQIRETGAVFRTVGDCARYIGGDFSKIYACLRGERRTHLGYTFQYYEETNDAVAL